MIDHSQLHTCQSATQRTSQETTFDHDRRPVSRCFRSRFLLHTFTLEFILLQFTCREQAFDGHEEHDGLLRPRLRHCWSPASAGWQVTPYHSTRRTAASTPQSLLVASIYGPPAAISCSYRDTGVPCSVVRPFL